MELEKFVSDFESAFQEITPGKVHADTEFKSLPEWNSVAALSLLAVLDMEYGVQVSRVEVSKCATVKQMFELVSSKKK